MNRISGVLFAALLAATLVRAAESPPPALSPRAEGWNLMGNGGPNQLPGSCEVGVDRLKSAERELNSVRCTNTAVPSFGGAYRTIETAAFAGKRVRVSVSLMASGIEDVTTPQYGTVTGEAGLWINMTGASGRRSDNTLGRGIKGTTGWQQLDFVFDMQADNRITQLGFWMQGKGQVWMKEIVVEEVPPAVALNTFQKAPVGPDMSLTVRPNSRPDDPFQPPPDKWVAVGAASSELCDVGVDTKLLKEGQRNLSISCAIASNASLRQVFIATPFWGKRVRFSGWIRTENVQPPPQSGGRGGAGLFTGTTDNRNTSVAVVDITGTTGWQYRELVMDVPKNGAQWIPVGVTLTGSGQVWARDFKFEEVPSDTPLTPIEIL